MVFSSSLSATSAEITRPKSDLTQFDYPFLLGDWYLINPNPAEGHAEFLAIRLHIASNYQFAIEIQNKDQSVNYWQGDYSLSRDTLVLGLNTDSPQFYNYSANHNQLMLNGIQFSKGYPSALIGRWKSAEIRGDDILASNVSTVSLTLQPDFMFLFMSESVDGNLAAYQGVYYYEGNSLVLLYEKGEHNSRYKIENNNLILESDDFDMYAVMNKVE
jgi:hypothetical protein